MIFGLIPLHSDFLTKEFKQSYKIYSALPIEQLDQLLHEMAEYEQANQNNPKFSEYWASQRSLCQIQLEKKKLQQTSTEGDEKLFTEEELEQEGEDILSKMTDQELETMVKDIKENIAADSSFASELQFWQNLGLKVR